MVSTVIDGRRISHRAISQQVAAITMLRSANGYARIPQSSLPAPLPRLGSRVRIPSPAPKIVNHFMWLVSARPAMLVLGFMARNQGGTRARRKLGERVFDKPGTRLPNPLHTIVGARASTALAPASPVWAFTPCAGRLRWTPSTSLGPAGLVHARFRVSWQTNLKAEIIKPSLPQRPERRIATRYSGFGLTI